MPEDTGETSTELLDATEVPVDTGTTLLDFTLLEAALEVADDEETSLLLLEAALEVAAEEVLEPQLPQPVPCGLLLHAPSPPQLPPWPSQLGAARTPLARAAIERIAVLMVCSSLGRSGQYVGEKLGKGKRNQ